MIQKSYPLIFFTSFSKQAANRNGSSPVFYCAPSGARFQRVKVSNPPGSGKDIAEGKGVRREVESEGSRIWGTY